MKRLIPVLLLFALSGCGSDDSAIDIAGSAFQAVQKGSLADFRATLATDAQTSLGTQEVLDRLAVMIPSIDLKNEQDLATLTGTTPQEGCYWHSDCANSSVEEYELPLIQSDNSSKTLATLQIECKAELEVPHSKHPGTPTFRECRIENIRF